MSIVQTDAISNLIYDICKLSLTFSIALATGWGFLALNIPAPFLMGSLFGVWIFGSIFKSSRQYLGVARWFHVPVIFGLGALIGANFRADMLTQISQWGGTVLIMVVTTVLVSCIGYIFLNKFKGYEPRLAFLCCIPGGQAEALALARDAVDQDYVVALFHLVRVVFVFVSMPLLLAVLEGDLAVEASNIALQEMPSIFDLDNQKIVAFFATAFGGFLLARWCRVPMPHLLGPMGLSSLFHVIGWVELPRVHEFVLLAQLAIGGGVGARLARVPFTEVIEHLKIASINTLMILAAYLSAASTITFYGNAEFLTTWMAFVPGGLYEVTLLALLFGFDVAFVAFHHTVRVVMIFMSMPLIVNSLDRR